MQTRRQQSKCQQFYKVIFFFNIWYIHTENVARFSSSFYFYFTLTYSSSICSCCGKTLTWIIYLYLCTFQISSRIQPQSKGNTINYLMMLEYRKQQYQNVRTVQEKHWEGALTFVKDFNTLDTFGKWLIFKGVAFCIISFRK